MFNDRCFLVVKVVKFDWTSLKCDAGLLNTVTFYSLTNEGIKEHKLLALTNIRRERL